MPAGQVRGYSLGFTLIEILVVLLILGILGAIMLPQYQRAVLKSRFAALMPIAKSMADSNEAYFLEHGIYADDPQDLPVQGRRNYPDGTEIEFGTSSDYSYVLATRDNNFPNNYIVYQKHSGQFPGEIHCEAKANDTKAQEVCKSYGPTSDIGETLTPGYLTYVLFGTGNGVAPSGDDDGNEPTEPQGPVCEGAACDEQGNITECNSGQTLKDGECVTCDIENATTCSTTSYAAASCNEGYVLNAGACEEDPNYAKLKAAAALLCPAGGTQVCTIKNGVVHRCTGKIDEETGECVSNGTSTGIYDTIYDADRNWMGHYWCTHVDSGNCYSVQNRLVTTDGIIETWRTCADKTAITKEGVCSNGYAGGADYTNDSRHAYTSQFECSATDINTTTGKCNKYTKMYTVDNSYSTNNNRSVLYKQCTTATTSNPEATCSGSYQPVYSRQYNEAGTAYKEAQCYNANNSVSMYLNPDGTCPTSYPNLRSYDSATKQYKTCTNGVNWATATCK